MLLQRLSRSSSAWRPLSECAIAPRLSHASIRQRREVHSRPELSYDQEFAEHGVPGLLSRDGYNIAWTKYQDLMCQKLASITAGFEAENASTKQLVLQFARNPATAALFNHASMAHNNHFFFGALSPAPSPLERYPGLQNSLIRSFGSIETLRQTMLGTADAMFGPGFVWLVATGTGMNNQQKTWRILTTYLAGTPYAEAGYRQQGKDMNVANTAGSFGASSQAGRRDAAVPPGGAIVEPVLCVNTWEHVYLADFGVDGKQEYLQRWWDAIHWGEVDNKTPSQLKAQTLGEANKFSR